MIPVAQLLPHFRAQPLSLLVMIGAGLITLFAATVVDTGYYTGELVRLRQLHQTAVLTPLNSLIYNFDPSNLAKHGLHPFYQHVVANLPQLLGPAFQLIPFCRKTSLFWSAVSGIAVLSCFQHQEPRFLLPAVPLLLCSVKIPQRFTRFWIGLWIAFNVLLGVIFGVYHQGGVVPVQTWISGQEHIAKVLWWKTYSPPTWLLNGRNADVVTQDLMGIPGDALIENLLGVVPCGQSSNTTLLVAPLSATFLDPLVTEQTGVALPSISLDQMWLYGNHLGLDDLDFGEDGVWPTLQRVVGRRGLGVWSVTKNC